MDSTNELGLKKVFVIAEAGVNHNGSLVLAKELIKSAKEAGADAIKFQNFKASRVISIFAEKAHYQKLSSNDVESQLSMLSKLELKDKHFDILMGYSKDIGILFMSTPKDIESINILKDIDVQKYKVGSTEINNYEYLKCLSETNKPIILSTGMSTLGEVEKAIKVIKENGNSSISLLHCVSQYPCPASQVNLLSMVTMRDAFKLPVGYSDHTIGKDVILAAVALGAEIIEKHFTIDKKLIGPDHKVSMDHDEMADMIKSVHAVESCLGSGIKLPAACEMDNIRLLRRSLVFSRSLSKGEIINDSDVTIKRPGDGLEPELKKELIGYRLGRDVVRDEPITWKHFVWK